jgi:endonuclease/exonuclease/phosphatase (EEP) superfamily protein YafD
MKRMLPFFRYLLAIIAGLAFLLTLVSVLPTPVWWGQVVGFPRLQTLAALLLAATGLLLACGVDSMVQTSFLWPYLPIMPKAVADATPALARDSTSRVRVLIINVLMTNRQDARLLQMVRNANPDVLLAMETNDWWTRALRPLQPAYPYRLELYSRLPLLHPHSQDLEQPGVPSVITGMRLPDGRTFTFFGIHPTPPIPDSYPDGVGLRNQVLHKVARLLRQTPGPALVAGDFNDVSWSSTIHQLVVEGPVKDISVGRGFYPTFDAKIPLIRWPLDHFFVTPQFRVIELTRPPAVGSDHFPLLAELALSRE